MGNICLNTVEAARPGSVLQKIREEPVVLIIIWVVNHRRAPPCAVPFCRCDQDNPSELCPCELSCGWDCVLTVPLNVSSVLPLNFQSVRRTKPLHDAAIYPPSVRGAGEAKVCVDVEAPSTVVRVTKRDIIPVLEVRYPPVITSNPEAICQQL